jgi:hypothetical protein
MKTMQEFWKPGDRSRAICEACTKVVETRFEYRTFDLQQPRVDVPDVLVGVCTECDRTVTVPFQSSPRLNAARKPPEAPLEARIPKHLEDVLAVVASHYGRNDSEFRAVVLRYYLHALGGNAALADHLRELAAHPLAKGPASARLSLKVQEPVLTRAWESARNAGVRTKTEMLKGAIIAAAEDLAGQAGRQRRTALAEMAASV